MIVVIFRTKLRADADLEDYNRLAERMFELVEQNPCFIASTTWPPISGPYRIDQF